MHLEGALLHDVELLHETLLLKALVLQHGFELLPMDLQFDLVDDLGKLCRRLLHRLHVLLEHLDLVL